MMRLVVPISFTRAYQSFRRIALLLAVTCASCGIPRDPDGTVARVKGGMMRVGVIAAAPRIASDDTEPVVWEESLIREFAAEMGARIEWIRGPEAELMDALKEHQLDLVIGGLTQSTPWGEHVALTNPYHTTMVAVGVPRSAPLIRDLAGLEVAVEIGDAAGAYLRDRGATLISVRDPARVAGPVAAPDWKLRRWGFRNTGIVLRRHDHVMAVPPGENGWLVRLERFLREEAR